MPKSSNQKLKLLYLLRILQKETDEEHYLNSQQLIERLEKYDISAERKSIYDDIARLTDFGYDIIHVKNKSGSGYYMGSREFELAELKLLVDVVQASRFITPVSYTHLCKEDKGRNPVRHYHHMGAWHHL